MMKPVTIHVVLTITLTQRWPVRKLDVNNAFLNGTMHEDVFMDQPHDFIDPS